MYGPSPGLKNENKSSIIKLMKNQNNKNNSIAELDKMISNEKDINHKSYITKKNNPVEYNKKITQYIIFHQSYKNKIESRNLIKPKTPKKPLLIPDQNSIQANNDNEEKYLRNNFIKYNKNNNMKNYVSPSFDYNIKNNRKNKDIKLILKNSNSIPVKLQDNELNNAFKIRKKNKQNNFSNSSIDVKASSSSLNEMDSLINKMGINNIFDKKNSEMKNKFNNNDTNNYNPELRKYISYTPGPVKKTSFVKNKVSTSHDFEEQRRKEEIKMIFEREFNRKMNTKKNKKIKNSNTIILIPRLSRNSKIDDNDNLRNSQSHKDLNKNNLNKEEYQILNYLGKNIHSKIDNNKSNFSYDKYYSVLQQKIKKLGEDISNLKNEEKSLSIQLINYNKKEKECNEVRKIREEIEKYKIIIEKSDKVCQEYTIEIQKIKNIIEDKDNNISEEQYININKSE